METHEDRQACVLWCKRRHAVMADNGTWAVPRSGLVFMRVPKGYVLVNVLPYLDEMREARELGADVPASPEELLAYQKHDFEMHQRYHKAAGLEMTDPQGLLR